MAAQDVIKSGSRWQVGDGSSVQIWLDKWLPQQTTFRVNSPPHTIPADSRVCTLINAETGEWQEDMIDTPHFSASRRRCNFGYPKKPS